MARRHTDPHSAVSDWAQRRAVAAGVAVPDWAQRVAAPAVPEQWAVQPVPDWAQRRQVAALAVPEPPAVQVVSRARD